MVAGGVTGTTRMAGNGDERPGAEPRPDTTGGTISARDSASGPADSQVGGGTRTRASVLARELGGDLNCPRCGYNLKGLSVRSNCSECGLPVRAAVLVVVDPWASELRPIEHARAVALGVVAWGGGALAAAVCAWGVRLLPLTGMPAYADAATAWLRPMVPAALLLSGLGALALVRPHAGLARRGIVGAVVGVALYAPIVAAAWLLWVGANTSLVRGLTSDEARAAVRVLLDACLIGSALCLRPNARALVSRSKLLRSERVDRQILLAIAGVVAMTMIGDLVVLLTPPDGGPTAKLLHDFGRMIVAAGSALLLLGLGGMFIDCLRLRRAIVQPPLSLGQALAGPTPAEGSADMPRVQG